MSDIYRSRTMDQMGEGDVGQELRIAGWVENIRDHGGVSFLDLRDMYGVMQVVFRDTGLLKGIRKEECISVEGLVEHRDEETYNPKIPTGTIELEAHKIDILGKVYRDLPFEVAASKEIREDVRLKYRYLDLRNHKVKENIIFRSEVINYLREKMRQMGFLEIQTPILCASSPEGARDYIVPSRKYKGKFYALPQAPQQYKQLLMASGFDKYFLCRNKTKNYENESSAVCHGSGRKCSPTPLKNLLRRASLLRRLPIRSSATRRPWSSSGRISRISETPYGSST